MKTWKAIDIDNAKYLGTIEFQSIKGEYHNFEIVCTEEHIIFGSSANIGFMQSGYMERDKYLSLDENLSELLADLECYYDDGYDYCTFIVCNDRM